jgi:L-threonine kinase
MRAVRNRADRHRRAYAILRDGLHAGDVRKICAAATLSALLQQAVMPREEWPLLLAATRECRGFGVVVAHSGTAGGVLFANPDEATRCARMDAEPLDGGVVQSSPPHPAACAAGCDRRSVCALTRVGCFHSAMRASTASRI